MKSENPLLKEKEITRDYYLKRMLIWQQISGFVPSFFLSLISFIITAFVSGALSWGENSFKNFWLFLGLLSVTTLPLFIISTYYSRQYWKSHKEYQELANPTLTSETATESEAEREREREREREINLGVGSQWEETLVY